MSFSIWENETEQWDTEDPIDPDMVVEASSAVDAAQLYAEQCGSSDGFVELIVRDDSTEEYFEIALAREWSVDRFSPTTLAKLCEP